ncbi:MAG: Smr/MutS family protein [Eubacteriales bacterium]|nr:Smr/MutS family protein [Eubacteriales bacterium]MDD4134412.1 Smr/MutS family protein [Eubacteriales bacterium]
MEVDLHGLTIQQARVKVMGALKRATPADYRLTLIHGYRGGSAIRDMLRDEFSRHPSVIRLESTFNPGQTVFVLREY